MEIYLDSVVANLPQFEAFVLKNELLTSRELYEFLFNAWNSSEVDHFTIFRSRLTNSICSKCVEIKYRIFSQSFSKLDTEFVKEQIKLQSTGNFSLTYGDIDFNSFIDLLSKVKPQEGEKYFDLGHGTGRSLIAANLFYPTLKIHGIEILPQLANYSNEAITTYHQSLEIHGCLEFFDPSRISVLEADFLSPSSVEQWVNSDILFINSTCFEDSLLHQLSSLARGMKPGSRIITFTRPLYFSSPSSDSSSSSSPSTSFDVVDSVNYTMSWGLATVYFHIKR